MSTESDAIDLALADELGAASELINGMSRPDRRAFARAMRTLIDRCERRCRICDQYLPESGAATRSESAEYCVRHAP